MCVCLLPPYMSAREFTIFLPALGVTLTQFLLSRSLDSRGKSLEHASHWAEQDLGHRAVMRVNRKQHGLLLEDIQLKDQGMYRCRVDFVESPTRNVRVRLRVVGKCRRVSSGPVCGRCVCPRA